MQIGFGGRDSGGMTTNEFIIREAGVNAGEPTIFNPLYLVGTARRVYASVNLATIGSDNALSHGRHQAII